MFGLLEYKESGNLGDNIQSIAASKFLSSYKTLIDRNTCTITALDKTCNMNDKIKVIYNGWFDSAYAQFPLKNNIDPLFISFHINDTNHSTDPSYKFLDEYKIKQLPISKQVDFFKKYEPIGCRDYHTVNILKKEGIQAYFSGCLTLTLQNRHSERTNEILNVDSEISIFNSLIPENIRNQCISITHVVNPKLSNKIKSDMAQNLLDRYAKAKLVITSRLHVALPCLAFNTPVIFIHSNLKDVRLSTYLPYLKHFTTGDTLDIDLNTYTANPKRNELDFVIQSTKIRVRNWIKGINFTRTFDNQPIKDGYSIVCACMNRNSFLKETLPTWVSAKPNEIIIVDWNSAELPSVDEIISKYKNDCPIKVIRVNNVSTWSLTRAYNLGFRMTSYNKILKVDCDTILDTKFFLYHNLDKDQIFFSGDWSKARNENETHTNGVVYLKRDMFFNIGGYNEYIQSYGYDDSDLYIRLNKRLKRYLLNLDLVSHMIHSNELRVKNTTSKHRLDIEVEKNRLISENCVWLGPLSEFDICCQTIDRYNCSFIKGEVIDPIIEQKYLEQAIKNRNYTCAKMNKKLYIQPKNGLGNRLRSLASAYVIARNTGRELIVVWLPDEHCQACFWDIFDKDDMVASFYLIKDKEEVKDILESYNINDNTHESIGYSMSTLSIDNSNKTMDMNKTIDYYDYSKFQNEYINDESNNDIFVVSACVLNNKHTSWYRECIFLQYLVPTRAVLSRVFETEWQNTHFENVIGIHIRMGQNPTEFKFEDASTYNPSTKASLVHWRNASNWKVFIEKMDDIVKDNPKQRFYLSADNKDIYKFITGLNRFNIIYTEREAYDRSVSQMQASMVDILLLSKCQYILGSNWSSFTEIAHRIGRKKLLLAGVHF